MALNIISSSATSNGTLVVVSAGDTVLVEADAMLIDTDVTDILTSSCDAIFGLSYGTADISGSVVGYTAVYFGGTAGANVTIVDVASTGSLLSLGNAGIDVANGAYAIANAGTITANASNSGSGVGILVAGAGSIVNTGTITAAGTGIYNALANQLLSTTLTNYGSIYGGVDGISEYGGVADTYSGVIYNYGSISSGVGGFAIYADATSVEQVTNAGTVSGGVSLNASNSGVVNSGAIDYVSFGGSASSLTNSATSAPCKSAQPAWTPRLRIAARSRDMSSPTRISPPSIIRARSKTTSISKRSTDRSSTPARSITEPPSAARAPATSPT